jgi:heat shock protein HslJ
MSARTVAASVLALLTVAGCVAESEPRSDPIATGTPQDSATEQTVTVADLAAISFVSTEVDGRELVPGSEVLLVFELGTMAVSAGCNTMFGEFEVADGVLRWSSGAAQTMKACSEELTAQDQWLTEFFTDGATASYDAPNLVLTAGDVTIEMAEQSAEQTDLSTLLGRRWTVLGTITDGATQRLPRRNGPRPTIGVRAEGWSRLNTGCNTGRTVVRVRDDTFVFGPTTTTRRLCRQPEREIERQVLAVLDGRSDAVYTHDDVLVVTKGSVGLVFDVS